MIKLFLLLVVLQSSHGWIINNLKSKILKRKFFAKGYDGVIDSKELADLRITLIYPGTKWCGAGNIADGYDDLGPEAEADMCCRDHDNCADYIPAGETKHNLTNKAFYSRLACYCDLQFRHCLREAKTKTANKIGTVYFDLLGTECYKEDYLITGCKKRGGWLNTKCVEYSFDDSSPPRHQWFDVPNYN
ncbi:unnamed protein product [Pieris macdunnoughi]|uniref:Phospholipase A2 n=1 Tax=Pieris macdunnoughi TaxID=345717 RepID=A0A821P6D9_9NEOP|nr:unnamed protein product [Pieris macdunnoughi]